MLFINKLYKIIEIQYRKKRVEPVKKLDFESKEDGARINVCLQLTETEQYLRRSKRLRHHPLCTRAGDTLVAYLDRYGAARRNHTCP